MPRFIVTSDWHATTKAWRVPLFEDAYVAMEEICTIAQGTDGIIHGGDLFNSYLSPDIPAAMERILQNTCQVPNVIYTVGNHDKTGAPAGADNPEWVDVLNAGPSRWQYKEGVLHEVSGIRFACIHHTANRDELLFYLEKLSQVQFDVLVMHQYLKDLIPFENCYETDSEEIVKILATTGVKVVVCGHTHQPKSWTTGQTVFISPGSSYRVTLNPQEPAPSMWHLTFDGPHVDVIPAELTQQRERHAFAPLMSDPDKLDEYVDLIRGIAARDRSHLDPRIRAPLVSFSFVSVPGIEARLREVAGDSVCLDLTPVTQAVAEFVASEANDVGKVVTVDEFLTVAQKYADGEALQVLAEVYRGEEPEIALNSAIARLRGIPAPVQETEPIESNDDDE